MPFSLIFCLTGFLYNACQTITKMFISDKSLAVSDEMVQIHIAEEQRCPLDIQSKATFILVLLLCQ